MEKEMNFLIIRKENHITKNDNISKKKVSEMMKIFQREN